MAGVTDKPFRQIVRQFGNHLLFTEMLSATSLFYNSKNTFRMMDLSDEKSPIAIQLVGSCVAHMVQSARMAEKEGAALIDINMGCPVKKLIRNSSGVALMQNPELAAEIVYAVKKAVDVPVTVKTRLGWDENNIEIASFAHYLEQAGVDGITIHGRTKKQGYTGKANWPIIGQVRKRLSIPVMVNGDITSLQSLKNCLNLTKADGAMIGRASLGKPWILSKIDGMLQSFDIKDVVLEHFDRLMDYYGYKGVFIARKHLAWYASGYKGVTDFRRRVFEETNPDNVRELIKNFFIEIQV